MGASGKICSERKERGKQLDRQGLRAKFTGGRKCAKNAVALGKGYRKQAATKKLSSLTKEHRQPRRLMLQLF